MEQIHTLVDELKINPSSRVLDLGCGNGMITEYISDRTQAHIMGIDVADEAVRRAQARTESKHERLTFQIGNVHTLDISWDPFDAIIAIDTLHIAVDLNEALRHAIDVLKPGGRMGVFWESWVKETTPETYLLPENTRLAKALKKLELRYDVVDFTEANNLQWQNARSVLKELKAEFEAEGNMMLYETAMEETNRIDGGKGCRYLYVVVT
jgi:ubiquinone/menaquinone biosynthesis C-methylase UbiE